MRPVGALLFGLLAEKIGRRPTLMLNVLTFSIFEVGSAFAPGFTGFLAMRALFGVAMGGEWGVGAALALESLPAGGAGSLGLLQEGYVAGESVGGSSVWSDLSTPACAWIHGEVADAVSAGRCAGSSRGLHCGRSRGVACVDQRADETERWKRV